jgi:hydrogenase/urease accessory protein HupE
MKVAHRRRPHRPGALSGLAAVLLIWLVAAPAAGHEVRPALLQISETGPGRYEVLWKQPASGQMAIRLVPHLSGGALERKPDAERLAPGFLIKIWRVEGGAPLDGQVIRIEGLSQSMTDTLVRVTRTDGGSINGVLRPAAPFGPLRLSCRVGAAVPAYLALGVEHILTGLDHLAFILALLLLIGPNWKIVRAVTAFTAGHSLTLVLAGLGWITAPAALIEALVALSIVFLASELVPRPKRPLTLTRRYPWLIALLFGLLHGLAFAAALAQIGLPAKAAPQALLMFNLGVEIGQMLFIAAALALMSAVGWLQDRLGLQTGRLVRLAPAYLIGGFSAYWFLERLAAAYS